MKRFETILLLTMLMSMVGGKVFAETSPIINFADANVKAICIANWDANGDGELSEAEAAGVTTLGQVFRRSNITTFNELRFFTHLSFDGGWEFNGCTELTSVILPSNVRSLGRDAFCDCSSLTNLVITSDKFTTFGQGCLARTGLSGKFTMPSTTTTISQDAFYGCTSITEFHIPSSVTDISQAAFYNVSSLSKFYVYAVTPPSFNSWGNFSSKASDFKIYVPQESVEVYKNAEGWSSFKTYITGFNAATSFVAGNYEVNSINYNLKEDNTATVISKSGGYSGDIFIPSSVSYQNRTFTVKAIGTNAFRECSTLTSVSIPNSVTEIGESAFDGCSGLTMITLPSSLTSIGGEVFSGCANLTSVIVKSSTPIPLTSNPFSNQANATLYVPSGSKAAYAAAAYWKDFRKIVENITFADANVKAICVANWDTNGDGELSKAEAASVTSLGGAFFYSNITSFNELQYFTKLTSINEGFSGCGSLSSVTVPDGLTSIGTNAFRECSALTSIVIPNSVTEIGESAFMSCSALKTITIPESVTRIRSAAFQCCGLSSINIPNSVTVIEDYAFSFCGDLSSVTLPNKLTSISISAFAGCGLTSITIPNSVNSIGEGAFNSCYKLKSITIPNSVTSIGTAAFQGCSGLFSLTIPGNVKNIGDSAFGECSNLSSLTISEGVTSIGGLAFGGCSALTSVIIPKSVTSIREYAFDRCDNLTSVTVLFETPIAISGNTFANRTNATLYVPAGCKAAFQSANNWKDFKEIIEISRNITFADTNMKALCVANWDTNGDGELSEVEAAAVTEIGENLFLNQTMTSFDEFAYFTGVTHIRSQAFGLCSKLESIVLPTNLTTIESGAFLCSGLKNITFPSSLKTISDAAFGYCDSLANITIPKSVTSIGAEAFYCCSSLASITVEAGNAKYDSRDNCNAVIETATNKLVVGSNTAVIPNTVTSIGNSAFSGCKKKSITLPSSITSIGSSAFYNAKSLESVIVEFTTPIALPSNAFLVETGIDVVRSHITVYVPKGCGSAFRNSPYWEGFKAIVAEKGNQTMELTELPAMTYGDEDYTLPAATTEGLALTWGVADETVAIVSDGKLVFKKAGSTKVTATQAGNDDYEAFSREFTLTVGKAALTITANNQTKTMGEENPELTVSYEGFVCGDDATVLTQQPIITTTATTESHVGTYPITVSGAEADNYEIAYVNGILTVTPAPQTLALTELPAMTYGDDSYTLPATTAEGLALTWTVTDTDVATVSSNVLTIHNAGTTKVTASNEGDNDYENFSREFTLTVNKAALTITAKSYTITQDDEMPSFEVTYSGFKNGDDDGVLTTQPTVTCSATDSETAGDFALTPSGATARNYNISYVAGTLTINALESVSIVMAAISETTSPIRTFSSKHSLDFTEVTGLKAYIASGFNPSTGELTLTKVTNVPAGEGLLLKGEAGEYEVPCEETYMYYSNLLKGVTTATTVSPTAGGYTNFILANGDKYGIGFYTLSEAGEIAAGKAYLQLPTSVLPAAEVRAIKLVFDDEDDVVTGVESVTPILFEGEGAVYNLNGQRIAGSSLKKGLYVVNGRKVLVR